MRILIVEDDPITSKLLSRAFEEKSANVEQCDRGDEAFELAKLYDFDSLIIDMNLPDTTACALTGRLRAAKVNTPIIVISSAADTDLKLRALFAGADDFLPKPFDPRELIARQQAVVRRTKGYSTSEIRVGRLALDLNARTVRIDDQHLPVTSKEYSILELLALRKGTTLTKETFLDHLYGGMDEPEQKIIDVFVCKLRKKIMALTQGEQIIETVWGHGYVLKDQPTSRGLAEGAQAFDHIPDDMIGGRARELEGLLLQLI